MDLRVAQGFALAIALELLEVLHTAHLPIKAGIAAVAVQCDLCRASLRCALVRVGIHTIQVRDAMLATAVPGVIDQGNGLGYLGTEVHELLLLDCSRANENPACM